MFAMSSEVHVMISSVTVPVTVTTIPVVDSNTSIKTSLTQNGRLQDNSTALIAAARKGDRKTVERLVESGANILAEDNVSVKYYCSHYIVYRQRQSCHLDGNLVNRQLYQSTCYIFLWKYLFVYCKPVIFIQTLSMYEWLSSYINSSEIVLDISYSKC